MRIVFFVTTVLEYGGGLEKYYIDTACRLAQDPDNQVDVISLNDDFSIRLTKFLSVFYFKKVDPRLYFKEKIEDIETKLGAARYRKVALGDLRSVLSQYDVIYSKNELLEAAVIKFKVGYRNIPPVIFGGHTVLSYPVANSLQAKLHNFLYTGFIYKFLASGVERFHVLNMAEEQIYKKLFPSRTVYRIYNPFDAKAFRNSALKNKYSLSYIDHKDINILWVGRLTEQKGVEDLSEIVEYINEVSNNFSRKISWTIVGDGELKPIVDSLDKRYENVHEIGHIDQKYISSIYASQDIYISTSKWEGYPYAQVEAISSRLEVLSYNIPGASDLLSEYRRGHLVGNIDEMKNELIDVIKALASGRGSKIDNDPKQFNPEKIYKELIDMMTIKG